MKNHFGDRVKSVFIDCSEPERRKRAELRGDFNLDEWNRRLNDDNTQFTFDTIAKEYNYIIDNHNLNSTMNGINEIISNIKSQEL